MELSALYRDVVETSPDGIWVLDLQGGTIYANGELARMYGVSREEFADVTVFDTLDERGRQSFAAHLSDVAEGRVNHAAVECLFVRRDGSTTWIEVRESALRGPGGSIVALLHRITDFSERRAMIGELVSSRERLDEAQRIASVGSWEWDLAREEITGSTCSTRSTVSTR